VPEGGLAPGDILLAQKIALETMEREVLALANRQTSRGGLLVPSPRREDLVTPGAALAGRLWPAPKYAPAAFLMSASSRIGDVGV
jgi:hypothetical protein